jgi:hypothetical protein
MDRDRDIARGAEPKDSFFAFGFWLLVFEVHTDTELDRVEEDLTARESEQ